MEIEKGSGVVSTRRYKKTPDPFSIPVFVFNHNEDNCFSTYKDAQAHKRVVEGNEIATRDDLEDKVYEKHKEYGIGEDFRPGQYGEDQATQAEREAVEKIYENYQKNQEFINNVNQTHGS